MRARAVQEILTALIEELQPPATVAKTEKSWLIYETMRQRFIQDHSPTTAAMDLAASDRTMFRWQQAGIALVCEKWRREEETDLRRRTTSQAVIPRLKNFVGRAAELHLLEAELRAPGKSVVMLVGGPGMGKTALAADLVSHQLAERLALWVTVRVGIMSSADAIVEELGRQLADLGQADYLKAVRLAAARQPYALAERIAKLLTTLDNRYLVCVDNVERLADEPAAMSLLEALWDRAHQGHFRLVLVGRKPLAFAHEPIQLQGLNPMDALEFIERKGLHRIPADLNARVYTMTQGAPLLLEALAGWVRQNNIDVSASAGQRVLAQQMESLDRIDAIERLVGSIHNNLDPGCQRFLFVTSAFRRPFEELDESFIQLLQREQVEDVTAVIATLRSLYLFTPLVDGSVALHPMTRQYIYTRLKANTAMKRRIHSEIAAYYERRGLDTEQGEAAHHLYESGEYAHAARLLLARLPRWILAGLMGLADTLARFSPDQLDAVLWSEVLRARGDVAAAQGQTDEAVRNYLEACALVEVEPPARNQVVRLGRLYHGLGKCHRLADQAVALDYYSRAIAELTVAPADDTEAAHILGAVYADGAGVLYQSGQYKTALRWCRKALAFSRGFDPVLEAQVHNIRGNVLYSRGRLDAASTEYEMALGKSQSASRYHVSMSLANLGLVRIAEGRWVEAREHLEQALALKTELGDANGRGLLLLNLASLLHKMGEDDALVRSLLQTAVTIFQQNQAYYLLGATYMNLGMAELSSGDLPTARRYLKRSLRVYRTHARGKGLLPEICRLFGLLHARLGDMAAAHRWMERSLRTGKGLGVPREVVMTTRVSGEIRMLAGEWDTAYTLLSHAVMEAESLDQYEDGLARLDLAELFLAAGPHGLPDGLLTAEQAQAHLRRAVATFETLPAKRELEKARLLQRQF
ncbi:MAG: tetratricopeptide repeat protein [Anaerolineae bacterium]